MGGTYTEVDGVLYPDIAVTDEMEVWVGKYNPDRTTFNHDICANAKGHEYFCYMMFRQKTRK